MKTYDFSEPIDELVIQVGAIDLRIEEGDSLRVECDHKYVTVTEEEGRLSIIEDEPWATTYVGTATLTVYLPVETLFNLVQLKIGVCNAEIGKLTTDELEMVFGAGNVTVAELNVMGSADIDSGTANVTVSEGSIECLDLDMGVGKLHLVCKLTGENDISLGVGSSDICLVGGKSAYTVEVTTGAGAVWVDGERVENGSVHGSGENRVELSGSVGSVDLVFGV